ncbi:cupin domain-containing protein [Salinisphaera sp. SPP-AMP-43]|uniref:cupin domain-containing protein n=1 Tax=Salinisphaera sp. SPP-AMP-43 TaxID=3121288 RepID=UPI003C6DC6B8
MTADDYIRRLDLQPHPEGGYYRQTYQAAEKLSAAALPERYSGARAVSTAIYFLLRDRDVSHLHRLASDEVWHHYAGAPLLVHVIDVNGEHRAHVLGKDLASGARPQLVVPRGAWFGAELQQTGSFALVGNTVAPGFDFEDFELAERPALSAQFPQHASVIERLTPDPA